MTHVQLLIATRKGLWIAHSDDARDAWAFDGPHFPGWQITYALHDPRTHRIWAAVSTAFWGPHLFSSADGGAHWTEATMPAFPADTSYVAHTWTGDSFTETTMPASVKQIWTIEPGPADQPNLLYAGVEPAALFISHDNGATWENCDALWRHPTRDRWFPDGSGAMNLHAVQIDPTDGRHLYASIATAGVFESHDAGDTWEPRNQGMIADYLPEGGAGAVVGYCPRNLFLHPKHPQRLYQKHRTRVFRSDDGGASWIEIGGGIPTPQHTFAGAIDTAEWSAPYSPLGPGVQYGFASTIDPADPDALFVVPLYSDEVHFPAGGKLCVYRTRDAGNSWQPLSDGLADTPLYHSVYRQALTHDGGVPLGLYLGTSGGHLFASHDAGDSWTELLNYLPPITSLHAALIEP